MRRPSSVTLPRRSGSKPETAAQRGGLARAVAADQRHDLARVHLERDAADRDDVAVAGLDALKPEQRASPRRPGRPRSPADRWRRRSGRPSAIRSPKFSTTMRWARRHHRAHDVLDQQDRHAARVDRPHQLDDPARSPVRVEPRHHLVEQQQRGSVPSARASSRRLRSARVSPPAGGPPWPPSPTSSITARARRRPRATAAVAAERADHHVAHHAESCGNGRTI